MRVNPPGLDGPGRRNRDRELMAAKRQGSAYIWVGNNGDYLIPENVYRITKFRKDGWPDMRRKWSKTFLQWAREQDNWLPKSAKSIERLL